ncbi:unnamed protein product [Chondrus crispus]|uniref:Aminoglycoside phosphotransferase domain-containing protein n=1 Tax=Chondrus crispus TaxID=2769 RepID=R7Q9W5_CHOCR|nr:unnamed protein product [Chondrus crispus]CDF34553.1 unnamed protein product [Chondrus crispus]|eukprot:XP_005714372.1 unnamed protein product [Chondrus crispus]
MHISRIRSICSSHTDGHGHQSASPWRRIGWFRQTEFWALSVIMRHGMNVIGRLTQKRNKAYSTVLSCKVDKICLNSTPVQNWRHDGSIYLKASHPSVPEPKLTLTVSATLPGFVPKILAVDGSRNAMLQIGAQHLEYSDPKAVMAMLANLHISSIQHIDVLRAGGVPYRGLPWISSNIANILQHPVLDLCRDKETLNSLRNRVDELQDICSVLLRYNIPDTLVHGDCSEANMKRGLEEENRLCFIDWANCCIAPPFFDLYRMTLEDSWSDNAFKNSKESYFETWTGFACQWKMAEAFLLISPIFMCYNLSVLLATYEMLEPVEQRSLVQILEDRVGYICETLDQYRDTGSDTWQGDGEEPSTYHFVIPSPLKCAVLVHRARSEMRLPVLSPPRTEAYEWVINWARDTDVLHDIVKAELGLNLCVLRPLWVRPNCRYGTEEVVLLAEILDVDFEVPRGLEWIEYKEALESPWKVIGHELEPRSLLSAIVDDISNSRLPKNRVPWRSSGWFKETANWITAVLQENNMKLEQPIAIMRNTFASCVLRCHVRPFVEPTSGAPRKDDILYVKALHSRLLKASMIAVIHEVVTEIAPAMVAVNEARNMCMERSVASSRCPSINTELLMKTIAGVHKRSVPHLEVLKHAGVPVYTAKWLLSNVKEILGCSLVIESGDNVSVAKLRANVPRLESCLKELSSYGIPHTLLHGDLHSLNIGDAVDNSFHHIFDWNSAYIGHPFSDFVVTRFSEDDPEDEQELAEKVYFQYWREYGEPKALQRVSQLALISYFCINLHRLQKVSEVVEKVDYGSVEVLCKESIENVLHGLEVLDRVDDGQ